MLEKFQNTLKNYGFQAKKNGKRSSLNRNHYPIAGAALERLQNGRLGFENSVKAPVDPIELWAEKNVLEAVHWDNAVPADAEALAAIAADLNPSFEDMDIDAIDAILQ